MWLIETGAAGKVHVFVSIKQLPLADCSRGLHALHPPTCPFTQTPGVSPSRPHTHHSTDTRSNALATLTYAAHVYIIQILQTRYIPQNGQFTLGKVICFMPTAVRTSFLMIHQ